MYVSVCVFFVFVSVCISVREKKPSARGVIRPQEEADVQPCGCVRRLIIATAHFQVFVLPFGMFHISFKQLVLLFRHFWGNVIAKS